LVTAGTFAAAGPKTKICHNRLEHQAFIDCAARCDRAPGLALSNTAKQMCGEAGHAPTQIAACGNNDLIVDSAASIVDTLPAQLVRLPRLN
jgi:hypothetical protein